MSGVEAAEIAIDVHHNLVGRIARGCDLSDEEMASHPEEWIQGEGTRVGTGDDVELDDRMRSRPAELGYLEHER